MIKSMHALLAAAAACAMSACVPAPAHTQPGAASDPALVQSRLAASEQKLEQLSRQVAMLQAMVDSHQQALRNLEQSSEAPGTEPISSQPIESLPDTPVPPAAPSKPPAPVSEIEPMPAAEEMAEAGQAPPSIDAASALPPDASADIPPIGTGPVSAEPNPQYRQAMEVFRSGDYEAAAPLFEAFAWQFPEDDLADNALYWAGECKYTRKKFAEAIERFKRVVENYPNGSKVPDALLKIGFAYISLGDIQSAETYLKRVVAQYPFSSAGTKAEERLRAIQQQ